MRHTLKTIGLAFLASAAIISCSHEVIPEIETPEEKPIEIPTEIPTIHTIQIKADGQDTRTQIVGTSSLWTEGDRLTVYQGYAPGKGEWSGNMKLSEEGTMKDGGRKMDFQVAFDYVDPEEAESNWTVNDEEYKFLYRAVYPAENAEFYDFGDDGYLVVTLPDIQHPTKTSFDPKADILTSRPAFLMNQPDELSVAFKRQTALGQMTLKGLPEGAELCAVAFYPSKPLAREFGANVISEEGDMWGAEESGMSIVMQMPGWEIPAAGASGTTEILTSFMTSPFSLGEGDSFVVEIITKEMVEDQNSGEQLEKLFGYAKQVVFEEGSGRELVFTAGDPTIFAVNMTGIEPMGVLPGFELTFDEYTEADFPHINDENDPYIEIPYMVAGEVDSGGDNPKKVKTRASSIAAGGEVRISFNVNHPWTVSFSEPWLSAYVFYSSSDYGEFIISAETNLTGAPREATMTIASQIYGEVTVRVVQEAMVLPDFELTFSDWTLEQFPELAEGRLDLPYMVSGGGGGGPKKTRAEAGDYIELVFEISHPWTVSFSESWLTANPMSGGPSYVDDDGDVQYRWFNLYATPNDTGTPREATMTIASQAYGEVTVRVVQETFVYPRSASVIPPASATPFSPFQLEISLDTDNPDDYEFMGYNFISGDGAQARWTEDGIVCFSPGTLAAYAYYYNPRTDFYKEYDPVEITIAEPAAPNQWYFLIRRDNKPYLIHRVGSTDTSVELSNNESAQANEMAFSADGSTVYVVGAVPGDNDALIPCLWTYDGSVASRTDYSDYPNMRATDLAIDDSDVYILVTDLNPAGSFDFLALKNGVEDGRYTLNPSYQPSFTISDITAEDGRYYLCGTRMDNYTPYYWRNLTISTTQYSWPLVEHNLGNSNLSKPMHYPESIAVKDGEPYVVGSVRYSYGDFMIFRRALYWEGDQKKPTHLGPYYSGSNTSGTYYMLHSIVKNNDHFVLVGEVYQDHNSYKDNWSPLLFYDELETYASIPLEYSSAMAGLNDVCLYNSVPALSGVLVDGTNTPHPAFWEAPWKQPFQWPNDNDTIVDFLVK